MAPPRDIDLNSTQYFERRVAALKLERNSFESHWMELSEYFAPRRGRFLTTDRNRGERVHQSIINSRGTQAWRVARAGLLAGTMSPARPWFALETLNPDLMDSHAAKIWLSQVERLMQTIFNQSNLYNMAPTMMGELLLFGTGCMTHLEDFEDVSRFYAQTAGAYMVAQNSRYEIDTFAREFEMTTEQMVKEYGLDKVSFQVQNLWDRGEYDKWHTVIQVIEPNPFFDIDKLDSRFKPFRSVHYEPGTDRQGGRGPKKFLRQSGFEEFPVYVPRWATTVEDIYGTDCPGMLALGDVKGLQIEEKRKAQAIDKVVNPPLTGPASLKNMPLSSLPGAANLYNGLGDQQLKALYQINPQINELKEDIQRVEARINEAFYADMFLAISNMDGVQPRNQLELTQRNEERLLQLGPVLEQIHGEFLSPLIDRTFAQASRAGILPEAPPEIQGESLRINFISSLARAQRAVATGGIERLAAFVGNLGAAWPDALDKFDQDQAIDQYADAIGTSPRLVVPDDQVDIARQQRAAMQMAAQAAEMAQTGANTAKMASDAKLDDDSVLSRAAGAQQ